VENPADLVLIELKIMQHTLLNSGFEPHGLTMPESNIISLGEFIIVHSSYVLLKLVKYDLSA
jgi:hypothetical protein